MGQGDPFQTYVGTVSSKDKGKPGKIRRLPNTPDLLLSIRSVLERKSINQDTIMIWAACCTCSFGFLRSGEITVPSQKEFDPGAYLCYGDVKPQT